MTNLQKSPALQVLLVENPYTKAKVDILPIFKLLNTVHDGVTGPESFTTLAQKLLIALEEINSAAACQDGLYTDFYAANSTLSELAIAFLQMKNAY